jgi:hypothetical protein
MALRRRLSPGLPLSNESLRHYVVVRAVRLTADIVSRHTLYFYYRSFNPTLKGESVKTALHFR